MMTALIWHIAWTQTYKFSMFSFLESFTLYCTSYLQKYVQNQQVYVVKNETRNETEAIRTCHQRSLGRVISVVHQFQFITTR